MSAAFNAALETAGEANEERMFSLCSARVTKVLQAEYFPSLSGCYQMDFDIYFPLCLKVLKRAGRDLGRGGAVLAAI